ncbi:MAG: sensor histidine kinase [Actinomycetota bacterium]
MSEHRWLDSLPEWTKSVRFRLTLYYSLALFALAALLVGGLYFGLQRSLQGAEPIIPEPALVIDESGPRRGVQLDADEFERIVDERTLNNLKQFSFAALGALFFVSLGVGWVLSGRVLAPIGRIADAAKRIQATDLSRRIDLRGPDDELKRLADTFDRTLERLDSAFIAQRQFVADASHELRNPLAVIRTNLDVALNDPDLDEDELRETALVVRRATERMSRLVDDLLALARLDSPVDRREDVELAAVAREIDDEFSAMARAKSVEVTTDVSEGLGVVGDREALKRAIANLVDNAIRYAPPGTRVGMGCGARDEWVWVSVTDRGPGIAPEDRARVFDRFWRADKARAREQGGSGLGLAIVKQVAQAHGGDVRLSSKPGAGTTFCLWLPAAPRATRGAPPEEAVGAEPVSQEILT